MAILSGFDQSFALAVALKLINEIEAGLQDAAMWLFALLTCPFALFNLIVSYNVSELVIVVLCSFHTLP